MSVPIVMNFDTNRIPVEGTPEFRQNASYVWAELPSVIDSFNYSILFINSNVEESAASMDKTLEYRNDTQNFRSDALSARDRAESAATRAEAVVIPEEATYSLDSLESALNSLLTTNVAQQAQISILRGE